MRRKLVLSACLAVALGATACSDQNQDRELTGPSMGKAQVKQQARPQRFERGVQIPGLPKGLRVSDLPDPRNAVVPTTCEDTQVGDYFLSRAFEIPIPTLILLLNRYADQVPTYEELLFGVRDDDTFFGYHGEYDHRMDRTERDVKRFWDINSKDIQVIAMHGTVLADPSRTIPTYTSPLVFAIPQATAETWAAEVRNVMLTEPTVNGGNHPLFTFNAFAFSGAANGLPQIPDKIVMGDGILDAMKALGFDDVALPAIFAHEFGHHIQYERGYFDELPPGSSPSTVDAAELTRYTELMADAFSAAREFDPQPETEGLQRPGSSYTFSAVTT
jgi:hypothetical protein